MLLTQREHKGNANEIIEEIDKFYFCNTICIKHLIPICEETELLTDLITMNCLDCMEYINTFMSLVQELWPFNHNNTNTVDQRFHEFYYTTSYKEYCNITSSCNFYAPTLDIQIKNPLTNTSNLANDKAKDLV